MSPLFRMACFAVPALAVIAPAQDTRAADVRALTALVEEKWSYLEHRRWISGLDLAALEEEALDALRATEPDDRGAFLRILTRYVAGLEDGHAHVELPGTPGHGPRRWPVTLADAVEGIVVHGVARHLPEESVRPGDLVFAVDGTPVEEAVAAAEGHTFASTAGARRAGALRALCGSTEAESVTLRLRREGRAEPLSLELATVPAGSVIPTPLLPLWQREVRLLEDGGIGYFRPGSFRWPEDSGWFEAAPERREEILADTKAELRATMARLRETKGLILDLRGNQGGTDSLGKVLAGLLLPPECIYFRLQGRAEDGTWHPRHGYPVDDEGDRRRPPGPLFVLIDCRTFSTADNLAVCLRDNHPQVTFIGRPTGAGTGAPRTFELPHSRAKVTFCTMRVFGPDGEMTEGRGVVPDVPVRWQREDFFERRDPDLARAMELARQALQRR